MRYKVLMYILLLAILAREKGSTAQLPSFVHVCHRNNRHPAECWKESAEHLRPFLSQGIPVLDIPAVDPYREEKEISVNTSVYPVRVCDLLITGAKMFEILDIAVYKDWSTIRFKIKFPHLHADFSFAPLGFFSGVLINGNGTSSCEYSDAVIDFKLQGEKYRKNGKEHIKFAHEILSVGEARLERIVKLYDKTAHVFVTAKDTFLPDNAFRELLKQSFGKVLPEYINKVYSKYSLHILHPEH